MAQRIFKKSYSNHSIVKAGYGGVTVNKEDTFLKELETDKNLIEEIAEFLGGKNTKAFKDWYRDNRSKIEKKEKKLNRKIKKYRRYKKRFKS